MNLPFLKGPVLSRDNLGAFYGLNQNEVIKDGEFSAMENMSGDLFPVLAPREKRRACFELVNPHGLFGKDELLWADGRALYYNGLKVADVEDNDKTFVGMAGYVVVYPDQIIFNTADKTVKKMNHAFTTLGDIRYTLCDMEGKDYEYISSPEMPIDPKGGDYWMDTGGEVPSLKQYSAYSETWQNVLTTYVKVAASGLGEGFKKHDGVKITGSILESLNMNEDGTGFVVLHQAQADYIVVTGILTGEKTQTEPITVERKAPEMDFVIEANNRLWGCSAKNHEIYASKLGDPFNWQAYEGIATDSFAATIESDGEFTGIFNYLGTVLFFKEHHIHQAQAHSWPPMVSGLALSGVQKGSEKSLAMVGQALFYKSLEGVMAYSGAVPQLVSQALGGRVYQKAVAGSAGYKYYISMQEEATKTWSLFVYDMKTNLWHREDDTQVRWFARCISDLFYIDANNTLWAVTRNEKAMVFEGARDEEPFTWYAQTGDMLLLQPDNKFISKLQLKMEMEQGASVKVLLEYDSQGQWVQRYHYAHQSPKKAFTVPIIPMRCDHFKLRLEGSGRVKVFALSKHMEQGSEL